MGVNKAEIILLNAFGVKNTAYHAEKFDKSPFFNPLSTFSNRSVDLNFSSRLFEDASTEKSR
jgi:hypothetical protein